MQIKIREEEKKDYSIITIINSQAFENKGESILVNKLRQSTAILSLVAENENQDIIGHIMFSRIYITENKKRYSAISLAPMAVLPSNQGKGIGGLLINEGIKLLKDMNEKLIVVLGHPKYYPRFGFEKAFPYKILPPFELQNKEAWMLQYLDGSLKDKISGTVVYPEAFNEV